MATPTTTSWQNVDTVTGEQLDALRRDGITALKGAFTREWAQRMREDIDAAFAEARGREGGAVGRGPNRYYVEIHPEQLRGFVELVTHPWVAGVCEAVLGPEYKFVEVGFDVPFAGAMNQPWHRDFPSPRETLVERRYTSLAFNLTAVDTEEDMGPFEIALGTQFDAPDERWEYEMFPPKELYDRYAERAVRKYPKMGDISVRSALTLHRGTANHSQVSRPVLILGVDGPEATNAIQHDPSVTKSYWQGLPEQVRQHLDATLVDELVPITQKHQIEGLVMGEA